MTEQDKSMHNISESRTIVIGDVHGCARELEDLLKAVDARPTDRLIAVGDLICKGPDSLSVMNWAMSTPNLECVLGNHEARFLKYWRQGARSNEKSYDAQTYQQFGASYERCMEFIAAWPLFIASETFAVLHAGIDARDFPASYDASLFNILLARQPADNLINLRRLESASGAAENGKPWYEEYTWPELIAYGHWAKPKPVVRENSVGLDTGCVYGGQLSALVLPEKRLVAVPAHRVYRSKEGWPR